MSGIRQDITGRKFNFLTATKYIGNCFKTRHSVWEFYCHCGRIVNRMACMVKSGKTKSCGCMNWKKEKDGYIFRSNHPLYETWVGMMRRCYVKTRRNYMFYGGRGIAVCDRWKKFDEFVSDMGERPNGMTLDRIDNNGNYSPENCRWIDFRNQCINRRSTRFISHDGKNQCLQDWANEKNINVATLHNRINDYGWSVKDALETPVRKTKRSFAENLCV